MNTNKLSIDNVGNLYRDQELDIEKVAKKLGISYWSLYGFMNKNNIVRRSPAEANYIVNKFKPQFKIKNNLTIWEEKLKIAGIMLYWAEGTFLGKTVDFVNANPEMVKIFLRFLREICGADERRLRLYLYAYSNQNLEELKCYWTDVTRIPLSQFTKPYVKKNNLIQSKRKLPFGLVHIRYNDKKLLVIVKNWIDEYIKWAGTQVAKGGRLSKGSVLSKGKMEK